MAVRVYWTVFARPTLILRFAGLPFVVYAVIKIAADIAVAVGISDTAAQSGDEVSSSFVLIYLGTQSALWIASLWVFGLTALRWHRFVLLNEVNARFADFRLGIGGRSYLWNLVVILCVGTIAEVFISGLVNAHLLPIITGTPEPAYFVVSLDYRIIGLLVFGLALGRIGLVLPAAAIGRPLQQMEAWDQSKPWGLWHVALIILVNLPIQAIDLSEWLVGFRLTATIANAAASILGRGDTLYTPIFAAVEALFGIVIFCLTISVTAVALSHNYLGAFGSPPATVPEEPGSEDTADRPGT